MMRFVRELRLIPVVLIAVTCLIGLKILGLMLDGGFTLADLDFSSTSSASDAPAPPADQQAKTSWAHDMLNYPDVTGSIDSDQDAAAKKKNADERLGQNAAPPAPPPAETPAEPPPQPSEPKPGPGGTVIQLDQNNGGSPAERAILER